MQVCSWTGEGCSRRVLVSPGPWFSRYAHGYARAKWESAALQLREGEHGKRPLPVAWSSKSAASAPGRPGSRSEAATTRGGTSPGYDCLGVNTRRVIATSLLRSTVGPPQAGLQIATFSKLLCQSVIAVCTLTSRTGRLQRSRPSAHCLAPGLNRTRKLYPAAAKYVHINHHGKFLRDILATLKMHAILLLAFRKTVDVIHVGSVDVSPSVTTIPYGATPATHSWAPRFATLFPLLAIACSSRTCRQQCGNASAAPYAGIPARPYACPTSLGPRLNALPISTVASYLLAIAAWLGRLAPIPPRATGGAGITIRPRWRPLLANSQSHCGDVHNGHERIAPQGFPVSRRYSTRERAPAMTYSSIPPPCICTTRYNQVQLLSLSWRQMPSHLRLESTCSCTTCPGYPCRCWSRWAACIGSNCVVRRMMRCKRHNVMPWAATHIPGSCSMRSSTYGESAAASALAPA